MKLPRLGRVLPKSGLLAATALAQGCSARSRKVRKGKPWVIGNSLETLRGDRW